MAPPSVSLSPTTYWFALPSNLCCSMLRQVHTPVYLLEEHRAQYNESELQKLGFQIKIAKASLIAKTKKAAGIVTTSLCSLQLEARPVVRI